MIGLALPKPLENIAPKKQKQQLTRQQLQRQAKFLNAFYDVMFEIGLYNKFIKSYPLKIIKHTNYGFYAHLYLATGLSFSKLMEYQKIIEENLQCMWIMKFEKFKKYAEVQIVLKEVNKELEYQNPEIKPWEMYLGQSFSLKTVKNNNNKNCMFLIAGATGSGKTRMIYTMLLSWILSCSPKDVELYISDVVKNEYIQFKDVKHVKFYSQELHALGAMMGQIQREFVRRKRLIEKFREQGSATNIEEYNKINKHNKLPYCYILIDEFSAIIPDKTDSTVEKKIKEYILDTVKYISKIGRSLGIFIIIATQKTTRDEIPSIIKNMSAVRLSLRANDPISSEVIMGNNAATGLPDRVAVYSLNGGSIQDYLFCPKITTERLKELLAPYLKNKRKSMFGGSRNNMTRGRVSPIPKGLEYSPRGEKSPIRLFDNKEDDFIDY